MLKAQHDQENLAFSRQAGAASKSLGQKPMGARFHKTPLKVPLNDENAPGAAGKSVLGAKNGNTIFRTAGKGKGLPATPLEPRTARAPLGNKTTNAKARTGQVQGVKSIIQEIEKGQPPATVSRRPKQATTTRIESNKLEVHTDASKGPLEDEEIEYAPPRVVVAYESEDFQDGALNYDGLKPANRFRSYYPYYHQHEDTRTAPPRASPNKDDENKIADVTEEWTIGDIDGAADYIQRKTAKKAAAARTTTAPANPLRVAPRLPSTIASRNAAGALGSAPRPALAPKPDSVKSVNKPIRALPFGVTGKKPAQRPLGRENPTEASAAVSRTTLGYNKGRTASSLINSRDNAAVTAINARIPPRNASVASLRPPSVASSHSQESTITPARFAKTMAEKEAETEANKKRIPFLSIFDVESGDETDEPGSAGDVSIHGFELPDDL